MFLFRKYMCCLSKHLLLAVYSWNNWKNVSLQPFAVLIRYVLQRLKKRDFKFYRSWFIMMVIQHSMLTCFHKLQYTLVLSSIIFQYYFINTSIFLRKLWIKKQTNINRENALKTVCVTYENNGKELRWRNIWVSYETSLLLSVCLPFCPRYFIKLGCGHRHEPKSKKFMNFLALSQQL